MSDQPKVKDTRARILEVALKLFQSKGFEATTMRDIAEQANMAVGAAYYHFSSKEEIVFAYYAATQEGADKFTEEIIANERNIKTRVDGIIRFKLSQLAPYRAFISVLGTTAVSPHNPLSPFSSETKELRDQCIRLFERACEGSNLKVSKQLLPLVPKLLWFYQMGIIFFWLHDESPKQKRTDLLIVETLNIVLRTLQLSSFPLLKPLTGKVAKIVSIIEGTQQS